MLGNPLDKNKIKLLSKAVKTQQKHLQVENWKIKNHLLQMSITYVIYV